MSCPETQSHEFISFQKASVQIQQHVYEFSGWVFYILALDLMASKNNYSDVFGTIKQFHFFQTRSKFEQPPTRGNADSKTARLVERQQKADIRTFAARFSLLYPGSHSLGHDPDLMTVGEV